MQLFDNQCKAMSFSCLYMLKRAKIDFCKNEKFFNFLQMIDFQRFKTSPRAWAFHTQAKIKIAIHHKKIFRKSFGV